MVRAALGIAVATVATFAIVATGAAAPQQQLQLPPSALPPLTADAQQLVDRLTQEQQSIILELRFLQLNYRDSGRAEDAAAIALRVRVIQQRGPMTSTVTAELVNEGLPTRDEPVMMSLFRSREGETLSFAVRGREDQPIYGTTTYTDTSSLETAVVHAGLLRPGQAGIIKVTPVAGQDTYEGTLQNGVQSNAYGKFAGSFRFAGVTPSRPARTSSMSSYRDLVGQSITIPVVGAEASRNLWGSDTYTDDSSVAAAAVHAGVLAVGEFGFVKVTLLPGQTQYDSSSRNGATSQAFESWQGSFRVERAPEPWVVTLPDNEDASRLVTLNHLRGHAGTKFVVQVVGSATGGLWGTDTYTDDSSIAAAAVHAGLLKPGETGLVRIVVAPGRETYDASERNGVKSQPFGSWEGGFRLERVAK